MIQKINDRVSVFFTEEGFSKSNAILIEDDIRIMIDSGPGKIISEARPGEVELLLNSHCHLDHVWDNDLFVNARVERAFRIDNDDGTLFAESLAAGFYNFYFFFESGLFKFVLKLCYDLFGTGRGAAGA